MLSQTLITLWFEACHGNVRVVRAFRDQIRDRFRKTYRYFKIRYRAWPAASAPEEETAAIFVPRAWEYAHPDVRRAVLTTILMREHIPVNAITSMEFVRDAYLGDGLSHARMQRRTQPLNIREALGLT